MANSSIGSSAGALTTSSLLTLTTMSAATATGIGAIVAVGIELFETFRSRAHLVANDIVKNLENPFGGLLSQIVDAKDAAVRNGTATYEQLEAARDAVVGLWKEYVKEASDYATQGPDFALVAQQSLDNLNGPSGAIRRVPAEEQYGQSGFVDAVVAKISAQMSLYSYGGVTIAGTRYAVTTSNWKYFALVAVVLIVILRKVL